MKRKGKSHEKLSGGRDKLSKKGCSAILKRKYQILTPEAISSVDKIQAVKCKYIIG